MNWERKGECNDCGHCCQTVGQIDHVVAADQVVDARFLDVHGYKVGPDGTRRRKLLLFDECSEHVDDRCRVYDERPQTCREFPSNPRGLHNTPCSYWFERPSPAGGIARWGGGGSPFPGLRQYADA